MPNKLSTLTVRWMDEVWNKGHEEAIDELMDADAIVHGIEGINEPGPAGFKVFYNAFRQQFPFLEVEVEDVISQENFETGRCIVRATDVNGRNVEFTGMTCICTSQGKITEAWNNFDFMTMYQQLGYKMALAEEMPA